MNFPKISIVTANYNQAHYLEQAIKSVLDQGYPNLEYIIIDGGSTDGSVDVIKKYESGIAYWVSEKDRGVCEAANKGFKRSTGELMACINSDDMLHPNALFTVAEIFSKYQDISWLLGASTIFDEKGRTVFVKQSKSFSKYHFLLKEFEWIQLESTFWRRSLWNEAGPYLDEKIKYACDFDLWMRFFHFGKLHVTDALIGGFRIRSGGQLSVDNVGVYMEEVESILSGQSWDKKTTDTLHQLQNIKKMETLLSKSRLFNIVALKARLNRRYDRLMDSPKRLAFDGKLQGF